MKYKSEIDGLRAFSVLSVVLFHAFPTLLQGGFVGVDVFFVISGYLITRLIIEQLNYGTFSLQIFFSRRIRRIFPALVFVMITSLLVGWFVLLSDEYRTLGKHIVASATFTQNFILVNEVGYFESDANSKPMLHLWSLAVEEQFYIIWPLILLFAWKRKINLLIPTLILIVFSFLLNVNFISTRPAVVFFWPFGRFWELLSGGVLAWFFIYQKNICQKLMYFFDEWMPSISHVINTHNVAILTANIASIVGVSVLFYSMVILNEGFAFPGKWAMLPVIAASLVIASGSKAWLNYVLFMNPLSVWLGLVSYPLYLWHWPILSFLRIIKGDTLDVNTRIFAVLLSLFLAWITYKFIEYPIRHGNYRTKHIISLICPMFLIGVMGFWVYLSEGLPLRKNVKHYQTNENELVRTPAVEEDCLEFLNLVDRKFNYCRVTDVGSENTVAVVGDSHAHVAYPGIASGLSSYGVNTVLLANSGCPTLFDAPSGKSKIEKEKCAKKNNQIFNILSMRDDIKLVLFFSRGPIYWTGIEPVMSSKDRELAEISLTKDEFFSGLLSAKKMIENLGKRFVYITENPELKFDAKYCLPRPFNATSGAKCVQSKSSVQKRFRQYSESLKGIDGLEVLDTLSVFCDQTENCFAVTESGELLYADDDHLSKLGSTFQFNNLILPYLKSTNFLEKVVH